MCWHCISPRFLEDQITRSLARLKMDTIDVFLLHNPEYFLKVENDHREYYRRIEQAFTYLETEVKRGRIQFYGISSNTFPESREFPEFTSFETTLEIAERISPSHHYAVIQFPFNLYEVGAWLNQDNSGKSLLEAAMQGGLGTLTNRPLNAFQENGMVRLADFPSHDENQVRGDLKDSLTEVMALEAHYPARAVLPAQRFSWGHILKQNLEKLSDLDRWKQVRNHQILPALTEACGQLVLHSEFKNWTDNYLKSTLKLFSAFTHYLECSASRRSEEISKVLADVCPDLSYSRTLSQKSIQVYRAVPGITSILVGMRSESYVQDCVAAMQSTPRVSEDDALKILEALHNTQ